MALKIIAKQQYGKIIHIHNITYLHTTEHNFASLKKTL